MLDKPAQLFWTLWIRFIYLRPVSAFILPSSRRNPEHISEKVTEIEASSFTVMFKIHKKLFFPLSNNATYIKLKVKIADNKEF